MKNILKITHPASLLILLHSNLIVTKVWKRGPVLKSGKPKEQLLHDHICHSLSHDAIFAYPEKLQLILPPASNDILENAILF